MYLPMNKPWKTKINLQELGENGVTALSKRIGEMLRREIMAIDCKKHRPNWADDPEGRRGGGSTMDDRSFSLRRSQVTNRGEVGVFHFCMSLHQPNNCFEKICSYLPLLKSIAPSKIILRMKTILKEHFQPLHPPSYAFDKEHMYTI